MYSRRRFLRASVALSTCAAFPFEIFAAGEAAVKGAPESPLIPAPSEPAAWPEFRKRLTAWRKETRRGLNYSGGLYQRPEFEWVQGCFSCCFLMLCDETFYNAAHSEFTVQAFLEQGGCEFGGYDAVVLWHAYPRIGFDERN